MNDFSDIILKFRSGEMTITEREQFKHNFYLNSDLRKEFAFPG